MEIFCDVTSSDWNSDREGRGKRKRIVFGCERKGNVPRYNVFVYYSVVSAGELFFFTRTIQDAPRPTKMNDYCGTAAEQRTERV